MKRDYIGRSVIVGLMIIMLMGACQSTPEEIIKEVTVVVPQAVTEETAEETTDGEPQVVAEKEIKLVTPGKLTVAFNPQIATTEYVDGEVVGVVADMIKDIASRMGLEPVFQAYDFPALIPALQSGRVDIIATGFSATQPRAQILYLASPWLMAPETTIVRPGFEVNSWEEAAERNLTLAGIRGYYQLAVWEELGIDFHIFDSDEACLLDVANEGADGCTMSLIPFLILSGTQEESTANELDLVTISGPKITADVNGWALNKSNPALVNEINQHVYAMWREGAVEEHYRTYFGDAPFDVFINPPKGAAMYIVGPWEDGVTPPSSEIYPSVTTISEGELTVGVDNNTALLWLEGEQLQGPEAQILKFVAGKLGLNLKGVAVDNAADAVRDGSVDIIAGSIPATEEYSHLYWQSTPIGFNPDYLYVMPIEGGGYPSFTSWEDVAAADGSIAVNADNTRIEDMKSVGVDVVEISDTIAGLQTLIDGSAAAFVASTVDFVEGVSSDNDIADEGIGWTLNVNLKSYGEAYVWGVKAGSDQLLDAINQAISAAWQEKVIAEAYADAFPGANVSALLAPGPSAIGTSWGSSKDYLFRSMWAPGPWLQRPGWVVE